MTRQPRTRGVSGGRALSGGLLLLTWLAGHGCGDDEPPKYATRRDSGADHDAGARDAGGDARVDPEDDGGAGSGGTGGGGAGGADGGPDDPCELSEQDNTFMQMVPGANDGRFSLTTGTTGFGVAFQVAAPSNCSSTNSSIQVLPVEASGPFATPATMIECSRIRELSLLHLNQSWRMVWVDNSSGTAELQSTLLDEAMSQPVGDLRTMLTTSPLLEERPVLALLGDTPVVAFLATDIDTDKVRISSLRLDGQSEVRDVIPEDAGRVPITLALSQIGTQDAVVAWVDGAGKPGVWAQRLDLDGAPQGEPMLVTDILGGDTTVDIAMRPDNDGGALIYSIAAGGVNREVRFRRLSNTAALLANEVKIVGAPLQGSDASIARIGGGYVVAYRALPGGAIKQNEIRVAFITREGNVARSSSGDMISYKVADSGVSGGRVTVRVSTDGQLLIGYVDESASGPVLRLVRRRLDCRL